MRRLTPDQATREPWVVFADIVLAALFLFLLFIFAQYIRYEKLTLLEELERRKEEVARLIREKVPAEDSVAVDMGEAFSQRITFSSDLLFATCRYQLTEPGRELVTVVGSLLKSRSTYFESIEIEGHTDPRQPTGEEECPFVDNWDLSSRRAATVVHILASSAALDPHRLSAVGRGQFRPAGMQTPGCEPGSGAVGPFDRPCDRRIEVVLQYSEQDIETHLREGRGTEPSKAGQRG